MHHSTLVRYGATLAFIAFASAHAFAKPQAAPTPALSAEGQQLEASFTARLESLKADLAKAIPAIDESLKAAYLASREEITKAKAGVVAAQQPIDKIGAAAGLVGHRKNKWIAGANKGIAAAEAALKKATNDAEREAAQKDLAHWQENLKQGQAALVQSEAALAAAKADEAKHLQALEAARNALESANAREAEAARAILAAVQSYMTSDKLDPQLVTFVVLAEATPRGLAEFASQGKAQAGLVDKLLKDPGLMQAMLEAGGAKDGKYGQAVEIYTSILKASTKAGEGVLQRLALATSLEHATPIKQNNPKDDATAPRFVEPVKRYQHFEKAHLAGELDPAFKDFSTWELRLVVNGDESEAALAWGREMLRNYRPDHVLNPNRGWRYSGIVTSDVKYGSQNVGNDLPTLQPSQNIIRNGGVCGRRAFFGRFILRAFGIPTAARPQRGHAALTRWTPEGWVVNLGAGWGNRDSKGIIGLTDADFLAETQSRQSPDEYRQALRAKWAGDVLGQPKYNSFQPESAGIWNAIANSRKKATVAAAKPKELAALGTEFGEANQSAEERARAVAQATVTEDDKKIAIDSNGVITIPAAACSGAQVLGSFLGGHQLFSGSVAITVEFDAPVAGKYSLTAPIVTVHDNPNMQLSVNGAQEVVEIAIPYTMGLWQTIAPLEVTLNQGKNTLRFTRPNDSRGLAIKEFTLTPGK